MARGMTPGCVSVPIIYSLPCNTPYKGDCGFDLAVDAGHPQSSRTPNSIFSNTIKRMYIKKDADIPLSFTIHQPPSAASDGLQRCYIRIMAVHKTPEMIADNLHCCIKHVDEQRRNGVLHPFHFVRSSMDSCVFFGDPTSVEQRLSICLPLTKLQKSEESLYTAALKFPCFTSDFRRAG